MHYRNILTDKRNATYFNSSRNLIHLIYLKTNFIILKSDYSSISIIDWNKISPSVSEWKRSTSHYPNYTFHKNQYLVKAPRVLITATHRLRIEVIKLVDYAATLLLKQYVTDPTFVAAVDVYEPFYLTGPISALLVTYLAIKPARVTHQCYFASDSPYCPLQRVDGHYPAETYHHLLWWMEQRDVPECLDGISEHLKFR